MTVLMETELFLPPSERYRVIRETTVTNWVQLSLAVTTGTNPDLSYEHKPLFHTYSQKKSADDDMSFLRYSVNVSHTLSVFAELQLKLPEYRRLQLKHTETAAC